VSGDIWVPPGGSADRPPEPEPEPSRQPTEAEIAEQLRKELERIKVVDLLVQTLYTVSSLGYHRLSSGTQDLPQARLAIEALRALVPVVRGEAPAEVVRDFEQVVANMQLAYADAVKAAQPPPEPHEEPDADAEPGALDEHELGGEG
jgi:hypothetical protein